MSTDRRHAFDRQPQMGWVLDALDRCALHEVLEVLEQSEPERPSGLSDFDELHPTPNFAPERTEVP